MRKLIVLFTCVMALMAFNNTANAQNWTIGGGLTMKVADHYSYSRLEVDGGYEFSDKWAIGLKTGFEIGTNKGSYILGSNVRFTPWHNDIVYIDIKAVIESLVHEDITLGTAIVPSLSLV